MTTKLAELKALMAAATPGPFEVKNVSALFDRTSTIPAVIGAGIINRGVIARHADDPEGHADAQMHAELRTLAPALIAAVEALKHLVSCISETRGSNADAALAESRAALTPFGENDEQKP